MTATVAPHPSWPLLLGRGLTKACPACGQRGLFSRWLQMADDCPRCGLHFERTEGHWIGALGMNTAVTFGAIFVGVTVGVLLTYPDVAAGPIVAVLLVVAVVVPVLFYPFSKTLWTAIDVIMTPLEPGETYLDRTPTATA